MTDTAMDIWLDSAGYDNETLLHLILLPRGQRAPRDAVLNMGYRLENRAKCTWQPGPLNSRANVTRQDTVTLFPILRERKQRPL